MLIKNKKTLLNEVTTLERGSPLHLAAKSNYLPICQILLLQGIDLTIKDGNGNLAKDVTTNLQIRNLIEKYEQNQQTNQGSNLIEEIIQEEESDDEEEEEEKTGGNQIRRRASPSPKNQNSLSTNIITEPRMFKKDGDHISTSPTLKNETDKKKRERPQSKFMKAFQQSASPKASLADD